jgi:hypothetical protein
MYINLCPCSFILLWCWTPYLVEYDVGLSIASYIWQLNIVICEMFTWLFEVHVFYAFIIHDHIYLIFRNMSMNLDFMHNYLLDLNKYHHIFMIVLTKCVVQMAPSCLVIYVTCNHICLVMDAMFWHIISNKSKTLLS